MMHLPLQNRNMVVFYGSQTGTAEEFSGRLSKDAQRYGMRGMSADPEEYDMVLVLIWLILYVYTMYIVSVFYIPHVTSSSFVVMNIYICLDIY